MRLYFLTVVLFLSAQVLANPANTQLSGMSNTQRQDFMAKYLSKSGERCPSVSRTLFQGVDGQGNAFWSVACTGGKSYQLMVFNNPTGSTKYLDCKLLATINGGQCFEPFR